ncbi:MAG: transposase family protein [Deltaproteobacteria bacterium]|nr:transposase family protein [Deltaproteobacteria bacterium]TLN03937.1 MAG: transposase family protein [bacterium]
MEHPAIFAATLGLSYPWQIVSLAMEKESNRLDISIDFVGDCPTTCSALTAQGRPCQVERETWFHDDFFNYKTFLHIRAPRPLCPNCWIAPSKRPWLRPGSKFTLVEEIPT